ncbi:RNA 2',3'-cyclic phosphodiesterase [Oceanobacillus halotolerans]|uniref:RNA 2',3'-cyclic phosphodiesterase n=1 Tax=Oceanobacillus halotolerans TaxID=2663380 RepID=UPI0013DA4B0B|nr:RNA 2',3'-cyclic phosphodiesterase [Oceanobacillus halotolerans]
MSETPHYFIAIPLPEPMKKELHAIQDQLKNRFPYKLWTHQNDLHITMKFLGAVEQMTLDNLVKDLQELENISHFQVNIEELGIFGDPKQPRVLWTGVEKTTDLIRLYDQVERITVKNGFKPEKREYRPHITLAKKWNGKQLENNLLSMIPTKIPNAHRVLSVHEVVVFQIFPKNNPKYKIMEEFSLLGGQ